MNGVAYADGGPDGVGPEFKRHGHGGHEPIDVTMVNLDEAAVLQDSHHATPSLVVRNFALLIRR